MAREGLLGRLQEAVEERTGLTLADRERLNLMEAQIADARALSREAELLGWSVLDYMSGNPQELTAESRKEWAQKARMVWLQDAQAGAAVDLMNDFVFGRGVPKPRAKDDKVQEAIDEAWDDPDNQLILTSYTAQVALGTDLSLQSNLFFVMFDDGEDGKVKLGLLNHDEVDGAVVDPDFRQRVFYYLARQRRQEWDFKNHRVKVDVTQATSQIEPTYYPHWRNIEAAEEQGQTVGKPEARLMGKGKVYHVALNRTSEQVFGSPTMRRLLRWFSAMNDFLAARVDMAQAAAAFIMRRKIKGTPNQVAKMASKMVSRRSELAAATGTGDSLPQLPPMPGSVLTENENVTHENLALNTNAGNAQADAQMIRAAISAATRFPQSYFGDAANSNLATATSLELPVLKAVESRQEVFEGVFRWFIDRVIERAVEVGNLDKYADPDETDDSSQDTSFAGTGEFGPEALPTPTPNLTESLELETAYEDQNVDEEQTERDLSYEFSMPNPLKRAMTDLFTAISAFATTLDPNGTNIELSRVLATIGFGEGFEIQNPADVVEKIFPDNYQDPALAQAMGNPFGGNQGPPPGQPPAPPGMPAPGADGQVHADPNNPYGAPGMSSAYQGAAGQMQQAAVTRSRTGDAVIWPRWANTQRLEEQVVEARFHELPPEVQAAAKADAVEVAALFDEEVVAVVNETLTNGLTNTSAPE